MLVNGTKDPVTLRIPISEENAMRGSTRLTKPFSGRIIVFDLQVHDGARRFDRPIKTKRSDVFVH
jgi:hypothetical protein